MGDVWVEVQDEAKKPLPLWKDQKKSPYHRVSEKSETSKTLEEIEKRIESLSVEKAAYIRRFMYRATRRVPSLGMNEKWVELQNKVSDRIFQQGTGRPRLGSDTDLIG